MAKMKDVTTMLKAIHTSEDFEAAKEKAKSAAAKLRGMKPGQAADILLGQGVGETLTYYITPALTEGEYGRITLLKE